MENNKIMYRLPKSESVTRGWRGAVAMKEAITKWKKKSKHKEHQVIGRKSGLVISSGDEKLNFQLFRAQHYLRRFMALNALVAWCLMLCKHDALKFAFFLWSSKRLHSAHDSHRTELRNLLRWHGKQAFRATSIVGGPKRGKRPENYSLFGPATFCVCRNSFHPFRATRNVYACQTFLRSAQKIRANGSVVTMNQRVRDKWLRQSSKPCQ